MARQHGTNRKRVENNSGSGAVGARGEPRAGGEGERKAEAEMQAGVRAEAGIMSRDVGGRAETVWWKGVPLTITPPLEQHRLDAGVAEIGRKGIEPKARARMQCGAAGFPI